MRLTIVDNDETESKDELCCNDFNEMRLHISRILSNWYDTILSVGDDDDDMLFSQRMHFQFACKSRLNWHNDIIIEKMHDTLMNKHFMIDNVEKDREIKIKMEASANFSEIDHTVCVFLNVLQELTLRNQEQYVEKLIACIEKMKE